MKKISVLLAFVVLFAADAVFAAGAIVTSLTGSVQAQAGAGPVRPLRVGDQVGQGDTVSTGPASSVVLKFDDGQIAALTAGSRMQIATYAYNPRGQTGSVLLSLLVGGMRAITGLIGHNQPQSVGYRAATATIGIRGSDGSIVTDNVVVAALMDDGAFSFTYAGQTIVVSAGEGAIGADGRITHDAARAIFVQLPSDLKMYYQGLQDLIDAINQALPGVPRVDNGGPPDITPGGNVPPGGGGLRPPSTR